MTRIVIGLVVCAFLTIWNTYPVYARFFPATAIIPDSQHVTGLVIDTVTREIPFNRKLSLLKSPDDALTLSRFSKDGQVHTLAVLADNGASVTGVDISVVLNRYDRHLFDVIKNLSYDDVVRLIRNSSNRITVNYEDLLPGIAGKDHLAIGINYAEHGKETGQVRPFMFPKYVQPDPVIHRLKYTQGWLLDHEVELGVVFPTAVCSSADLDHILVGFLVVNDFTDRATLMRKMDSKNVVGGRGFPDAKSKEGFLPTGPYMVIPRDWRAFVKELQLTLSVNGKVRQSGSAKDMVWNIDTIVERSLSVKGQANSFYQDSMVKLFEGDCIPANSIIVTGTPSGVVFNAPSKGFIFGAVTKYIFTGGFFSAKMHPYILKQYLRKELSNPRYLKPGDYVESSISYLGTIKTNVQE